MNRTRTIYFLSAIVLIIGCYALNLSYSLFVQTEEKSVINSYVPGLLSELSIKQLVLAPNEEYIVKETISNVGNLGMSYALNASSNNSNTNVGFITEYPGELSGTLETNESKDAYLYLKNNGTTQSIVTFSLEKSYDINSSLTSNITNYYTARNENTLAYKMLGAYSGDLGEQFGNIYISNNGNTSSSTATSTVTFTPTKDGNISFNWQVSSESNFDKFSVKLNNNTLVNNVSGINSGTVNENITAGTNYTLTFTYSKDGSVNTNGDKAIISDLFITSIDNPEVVINGTYGFVPNVIYPPAVGSGANVNSTTPSFTGVATTNEGIFAADDDYGTSYYYRGAQTNNYVNFAGYKWRIVRVNGDGSIRIILDGNTGTNSAFNSSNGASIYAYAAGIGYMYGSVDADNYDGTHDNINNSTIKTAVDNFYTSKIQSYSDYLSDGLFCGDKTPSTKDTIFTGNGYSEPTYFSATTRLVYETKEGEDMETQLTTTTPTLKCAEGANNDYSRYTSIINTTTTTPKGVTVNNDLTYPIGLLTADEAVMAGAWWDTSNTSYYLYQPSSWYTMTPFDYQINYYGSEMFIVNSNGSMYYSISDGTNGVRPVVNLKSNILVSDGAGTSGSPYQLSLS